jgi:hypothetical protein
MRRPGITLLEVLSAIFITGIGLLSLLTLFPLGALQMARALQDDRAAMAGATGQSLANAVVMRLDPDVQAAMLNQQIPSSLFTGSVYNGGVPFPALTVSPDGPGLPVLVDPIGVLSYTGQPGWPGWVAYPMVQQPTATAPAQGIPRICGQWGPFSQQVLGLLGAGRPTTGGCLNWCTVQDDIQFVTDGPNQGLAFDPTSTQPFVYRNLNYSYAWMLRMPRAGAPNVVNVSVLVFSGRSLDLVGFGTQEQAYTAVFNAPSNTVAIYPYPAAGATEPPSLRKGQWILDASMGQYLNPNTGTNTLSVRGFFYRIVSVDDTTTDANGNVYVNVEVQTPLRGWVTPDPAFRVTPIAGGPAAPGQLGTVVIFDNLVEVFDDGTF